jgi:hypothetical protein
MEDIEASNATGKIVQKGEGTPHIPSMKGYLGPTVDYACSISV